MKLSIRTLEDIPGIGKQIAKDLRDLGIKQPADLKGKNPELLYEKLCALRGQDIDRCMLYTFRCAIYAVSVTRHDPKKLQWWHWKDAEE